MSIHLIPKDSLNNAFLPYLCPSELLNIRLVDRACRESVDSLMKDTRGWIHDPNNPRGGVFIQRSIERVPQGLNDLQYVFRLFKEASRLYSYVPDKAPLFLRIFYRHIDLGTHLDRSEHTETLIRQRCIRDILSELPPAERTSHFSHLSTRAARIFLRKKSFNENTRKIIEDFFKKTCVQVFNNPTISDETIVATVLKTIHLDCVDIFKDFLSSGRFTSLPHNGLGEIVAEIILSDNSALLDQLMKSSRSHGIMPWHYSMLQFAKNKKSWKCVDLLRPHIEKVFYKSFAISAIRVGVVAALMFLIIRSNVNDEVIKRRITEREVLIEESERFTTNLLNCLKDPKFAEDPKFIAASFNEIHSFRRRILLLKIKDFVPLLNVAAQMAGLFPGYFIFMDKIFNVKFNAQLGLDFLASNAICNIAYLYISDSTEKPVAIAKTVASIGGIAFSIFKTLKRSLSKPDNRGSFFQRMIPEKVGLFVNVICSPIELIGEVYFRAVRNSLYTH